MAILSRVFTTAALAIAGVGAAFTFADAAQSAAFTVGQVTTPGFTFQEGDKIFSNFAVTGSTTEAADQIAISFVSGNYQVDYTSTGGSIPALTTDGSLSYTVTIAPGFTNVFQFAGTDAQGGPLVGADFSKTMDPSGLIGGPLVFNVGGGTPSGSFNPNVTSTNVVSTWTIANGSNINSFSDKFTQDPIDPTPDPSIPEPSAVVGMLALGLAGVVARRQKG